MRHKIASCVKDQPFSVIRTMGMLAAELENVISLGIGEPDHHTPAFICEAAYRDTLAGHTHYTHSQGDPELRRAISDSLADSGLTVPPDAIQITSGAMHGLGCAMRALLEEGDEVLVPEPHFSDYRGHVALAGGKLVTVPTRFEEEFIPDPKTVEAAVTPRTRVLLLNSPCNPTGAVIPGEILDELAAMAVRRDLIVISDEVYDKILHEGRHESIVTRPGMAERTVVINSFSKTFAMTGWRIGYWFGPKWFTSEAIKVVSYTSASSSAAGQRAALAAIRGDQAPFQAMYEEFSARCRLAADRLNGMPGVRVLPARGTFYLFPDVSAHLTGATPTVTDLAVDILNTARVVTVPGDAFGPSGAGCLRLACTVDDGSLNEAMDRLEDYFTSRAAADGTEA